MLIHNKKESTIAKFIFINGPLIVALALLVAQLFKWIQVRELVIAAFILFGLGLLITLVFQFHFLEIRTTDKKIKLKYYHLFPLIREYRQIDVPLDGSTTFLLKKSLGGAFQILQIEIDTPKGRATYPAIPLSLLNRKKRQQIYKLVASLS